MHFNTMSLCKNAIQNNGFIFSKSLVLVILREYRISETYFYFFPIRQEYAKQLLNSWFSACDKNIWEF